MLRMPIVIAPLVAFLIGLCAVPTARWVALEYGFLDNPDRGESSTRSDRSRGWDSRVWLATWSGWGVSLLGALLPMSVVSETLAGFLRARALSSLFILCLGVVDDCDEPRRAITSSPDSSCRPVFLVVHWAFGSTYGAASVFELPLGICAGPRQWSGSC